MKPVSAERHTEFSWGTGRWRV